MMRFLSLMASLALLPHAIWGVVVSCVVVLILMGRL